MSVSLKQLGVYLGLLAVGSGAGIVGARYLSQPTSEPLVSARPALPSIASPERLNFIAAAVQKVGPAVVRIDSSRTIASQPDFTQPFFRRFFGNQLPPPERFESGTGSGFILSADGRLITNAHVVEGADTVKVTLKNGQIFEGQVLGTDPITDIAVIEIEANDLPTVTLGDAESLTPGEWAIAIGNPLGLDNTVTVGIISAIDRSSSQVGVPDKRVRFIQTDAAINPGNSGGPLLNAQGEVVGINTAIRADAQGLGFAIPIETAQRVAEQLFATGQADHPYLGIQMVTLNDNVQEEINQSDDFDFQVSQAEGVLIVRVVENSPAQRAGLQPGDVIVDVGGQTTQSAVEVQEQVEASEIGASLDVVVIRNQQQRTVVVRPGEFPRE
ncbi:MAG: HhoA/HhoB/HtrA family serine endopeptidase [Cyanophyceae cyanobacterium]